MADKHDVGCLESGPAETCDYCSPRITFPGMETAVEEHSAAVAEYSGEQLTAELQKPAADISQKAGEIERESPLFFGTGDNPDLWRGQ